MSKSSVIRVPDELVKRLNMYDKSLKEQGINVPKTDMMRRFAENSITPTEDLSRTLKIIGKQPFKL